MHLKHARKKIANTGKRQGKDSEFHFNLSVATLKHLHYLGSSLSQICFYLQVGHKTLNNGNQVRATGRFIGLSLRPTGRFVGLSLRPPGRFIGLSLRPSGRFIGLSLLPSGRFIGLSLRANR